MRLRLLLVLIALGLGGCAAGSSDERFSPATVNRGGQRAGDTGNPVGDRVNGIASKLALAANPGCMVPQGNQTAAHLDAVLAENERVENFGPTFSDNGQGAQPILAATNCAGLEVVVISSGSTFASTNGRRIQVARGFVDYAHNDSELAFVIAHEMAHMLRGHKPVSDTGVRYAQEVEADHLGLQLLVRAGYDPDGAIELLRRLQGSSSASTDPRYPSFTARAAILQRETAQLIPNAAISASP